jgi:hypothetical protein
MTYPTEDKVAAVTAAAVALIASVLMLFGYDADALKVTAFGGLLAIFLKAVWPNPANAPPPAKP